MNHERGWNVAHLVHLSVVQRMSSFGSFVSGSACPHLVHLPVVQHVLIWFICQWFSVCHLSVVQHISSFGSFVSGSAYVLIWFICQSCNQKLPDY